MSPKAWLVISETGLCLVLFTACGAQQFNDDLGTHGPAPEGKPTWQPQGMWQITDGTYRCTGNGTSLIAGRTFGDFAIAATVRFEGREGDSAAGFVLRRQDDTHLYAFQLRPKVQQAVFYKRLGDRWLPDYQPWWPLQLGRAYHLRVVVSGRMCKVYLDGTLRYERHDLAELSSGQVGLTCYEAEASFDDVRVEVVPLIPVLTQSDLQGGAHMSNRSPGLSEANVLEVELSRDGTLVVSTPRHPYVMAVHRPIVMGIWDMREKEDETLTLARRTQIRAARVTERSSGWRMAFTSRRYKVQAKVAVTLPKMHEWLRYAFEFVNESNEQKALLATFTVELFPFEGERQADRWFALTQPGKEGANGLALETGGSVATYGVPQLAYGGDEMHWGWMHGGFCPILSLFDSEEDVGIFAVTSPFHSWEHHLQPGGKRLSFSRVIGLAPKVGATTREMTTFADGVHPLEIICGPYGGAAVRPSPGYAPWKETVRKFYEAYHELRRSASDPGHGGYANFGWGNPETEEFAQACRDAGFDLFMFLDESFDEQGNQTTNRRAFWRRLSPLAKKRIVYRAFPDVKLELTAAWRDIRLDKFSGGLRTQDYDDLWVRKKDGSIHFGWNVPSWPYGNFDPKLPLFQRFAKDTKKMYQEEVEIDGIWLDDVAALVDYGHPSGRAQGTAATPFRLLDREAVAAVLAYRRVNQGKLFYFHAAGGIPAVVASKYVDGAGAEVIGGESVAGGWARAIKVLYSGAARFCIDYPFEHERRGKRKAEAQRFCVEQLNKTCLFWGLLPAEGGANIVDPKAHSEVLRDFAQTIPLCRRLNGMEVVWGGYAVHSSHNLSSNVFRSADSRTCAVSLENTTEAEVVDELTLDTRRLGLRSNASYTLSVWQYRFADSRSLPVRAGGREWVAGKDLKPGLSEANVTISVPVLARSVSVLWIARRSRP